MMLRHAQDDATMTDAFAGAFTDASAGAASITDAKADVDVYAVPIASHTSQL